MSATNISGFNPELDVRKMLKLRKSLELAGVPITHLSQKRLSIRADGDSIVNTHHILDKGVEGKPIPGGGFARPQNPIKYHVGIPGRELSP